MGLAIVTWLQALILGIVQGITEFFPVSSSTHLRLARYFLDVGDVPVTFDLACHAGTLAALALFFRKEIVGVLSSLREMSYFALAVLPLVPAYVLLSPLRKAAADPAYLSYTLFITGTLLLLATRTYARPMSSVTSGIYREGLKNWETGKEASSDSRSGVSGHALEHAANEEEESEEKPTPPETNSSVTSGITPKWTDVLWIGAMQACALIPGISRSAATISAARFRGWSWIQAARFSFLLSVPTIIGGEIVELSKLPKGATTLGTEYYLIAATAAFIVGSIAVRALFVIYEKAWVKPIAFYCFGVALLAWSLFHG
jgi:undecaprenyl-diphosphatase